MISLLIEHQDERRWLDPGCVVRSERQRLLAALDLPNRFAFELVGKTSLQFQRRNRIGYGKHRVLVQLALAKGVHGQGAERRCVARQTDGEVFGLEIYLGGSESGTQEQKKRGKRDEGWSHGRKSVDVAILGSAVAPGGLHDRWSVVVAG